jgi:hypothetical protein
MGIIMFRAANCYKTKIATQKNANALAPTFSVEIDHCTLIAEADKYIKQSKNGFAFAVINSDKLEISITPQAPFDEIDKLFRSACAMLTNHKLTSKECAAIISAYETHLSHYGVNSTFSARRSSSACNGMNRNGVC